MVALFGLMFLLQYNLPKKFQWNATFYHSDAQPFGCYVFDSVLRQSMPHGYYVTSKTFRQLDLEHHSEKIGVLMVVDEQGLTKLDIKYLCNIVQRGGKVMVVAGSSDPDDFPDKYMNDLERTFKIKIMGSSYFRLNYILRRNGKDKGEYLDTIRWKGIPQVYHPDEYVVWTGMANAFLYVADSVSKKQYWAYRNNEPIAVSVPCGKGEVVFVTTPLLFTNYGMLEGNTSEYIFRLMSSMADLPVYRTEAYLESEYVQNLEASPLREFLKRQPLRWSIYLTMLGVLLFMVTTARRKQRVIPIIAKSVNSSLEFICLIGTLYHQRCSRTELVQKKFLFFSEELRRRAGLEISDLNTDDDTQLLAIRTGMDITYVKQTLREIRLVIHSEQEIRAVQMIHLIDAMNEILAKI